MTPIIGVGDASPWSSPEALRKDDGDDGGFAKRLDQAGRKPTRDDRRDGDDRTRAKLDAPWQAMAAFLTPMPVPPAPAAAAPDAGPREEESSTVEAKASDKTAAEKPGEPKSSAAKADKADKNEDAKADAKADQEPDQKVEQKADQKADQKAEKTADHGAGAKVEGGKQSAETVTFKPSVELAAAHHVAETVTTQVTLPPPTPVAPATAMPVGAIAGAPPAPLATEAEAAAAGAAAASLAPDTDAPPERGHIGSAKAEVVIGEGADKLSVRITAVGNQVRVEAAAASAGLALAIQRSSEELRAALSRHGLELSELGSDASEPEGKEEPKDGNDVPRVARKSWRTVA